MSKSRSRSQSHFTSISQTDVPTGRNGKHKKFVTAILEDLATLEHGRSLRIALSALPDSKVNIRSALNRATRKLNKNVATAADDKYLYIWNDSSASTN